MRRRFGRGVAEGFLRPLTLGIYGTRPEDLGAADAFPTLPEMERAHGGVFRGFMRKKKAGAPGKPRARREVWVFEEGMEAFPKAIAAALGAEVVTTSTPVTDVSPAADSRRGPDRRRGPRPRARGRPRDDRARTGAPRGVDLPGGRRRCSRRCATCR